LELLVFNNFDSFFFVGHRPDKKGNKHSKENGQRNNRIDRHTVNRFHIMFDEF